MKEIFTGIFEQGGKIYTESAIKGFNPFNEEIIEFDNKEFCSFDPTRSKLSAAIMKRIKEFPIKNNSKVFYMGAAHGYTVSHLASIVRNGFIYAIEFAFKPFNELLLIADKLKNIAPIFADARKPEEYPWVEKVDLIYCDIAQPDQTEIAIRNCSEFLRRNGFLMLAIKTPSIDVTKPSKVVVENEIKKLERANFEIVDKKMLDPYEENHGFIIAKY